MLFMCKSWSTHTLVPELFLCGHCSESLALLVPNYIPTTLLVLRNLCVNKALRSMAMGHMGSYGHVVHVHQSDLRATSQNKS